MNNNNFSGGVGASQRRVGEARDKPNRVNALSYA